MLDAAILGSLQLTSGWGVVLSIIVLGGLFLVWLFTGLQDERPWRKPEPWREPTQEEKDEFGL